MGSFRGYPGYSPPKAQVDKIMLDLQAERVEMIAKAVKRNVFDYQLIFELPEELYRLKLALANKAAYKKHIATLIELELRLAPVLNFARPFVEKFYSRKVLLRRCKPPVTALAFKQFEDLAKDHFTNQIFAFLLLDELAQASRVNHRWHVFALAVKVMTPYAYIKRHKVLIQLTHLTSAPLFGDLVANMHASAKANKLSFWKSYNEKIEDVPLKLLQIQTTRLAKLKG